MSKDHDTLNAQFVERSCKKVRLFFRSVKAMRAACAVSEAGAVEGNHLIVRRAAIQKAADLKVLHSRTVAMQQDQRLSIPRSR